jgi:hypothetical protein
VPPLLAWLIATLTVLAGLVLSTALLAGLVTTLLVLALAAGLVGVLLVRIVHCSTPDGRRIALLHQLQRQEVNKVAVGLEEIALMEQ